MWWWIGAIVVWLLSAAWIFFMMSDVVRKRVSALSPKLYPGYLFHGATAVLALWLMMRAIGA